MSAALLDSTLASASAEVAKRRPKAPLQLWQMVVDWLVVVRSLIVVIYHCVDGFMLLIDWS